jgi:hypothetical protein
MLPSDEHYCDYRNCTQVGRWAFRSAPGRMYCKKHFEKLAPFVHDLEMKEKKPWIIRSNDEEDNTPARQPRPW